MVIASKKNGHWLPTLDQIGGPIYLRIVEALKQDIQSGTLAAGAALPSQRDLAASLGINFTTVTRAYDEARRRGLIHTQAGQGTFVRAASKVVPDTRTRTGMIDLASNWQPRVPLVAELSKLLAAELSEYGAIALEKRGGPPDPRHLQGGEAWVEQQLNVDVAGRLVIAAGARNALVAVMSQIAGAGGTMMTESLGWPAIKALTDLLGIRLIGLEMDEQGILPDSFDHCCRSTGARLLYCVPTLQNPTGSVMGLERRRDIIAVARLHGVAIIEDDAYGRLQRDAPPPLAALAPDVTLYITGLSKYVAPGIRVGYLVCRDSREAQRVSEILRFTMLVAPPLELLLATSAIESGLALRILDEISAEMKERHSILKSVLPNAPVQPGALHTWLGLPKNWPRAEFVAQMATRFIRIAPSDAFAVPPGAAPNNVRLSIGAAATRQELKLALGTVADLLETPPNFAGDVA